MSQEKYPQDLIVTAEDFKNNNCQKIIDNIKVDSYSSYWTKLSEIARDEIDKGNIKVGKIFWVLADACSMMLNPSSINEPFKPLAEWHQPHYSRSAMPDDFNENEIKFIEDILELCSNYKIKSRLADILWLIKVPRNPKYVKIAIENYQLFPIEYDNIISDSRKAWERAIILSLLTKNRLDKVHEKLMYEFKKADFSEGRYLLKIEELLVISKIGKENFKLINEKLKSFALKFKDNKEFVKSRSYFEASQRWTSDKSIFNKLIIEIAESYVIEAESVSPLVSGHFYENAIQKYRTIQNKYRKEYNINNKIDEIHKKMTESNLISLDYMHLIGSETTDISEIANSSIKIVSGKEFKQAMTGFANISLNPKVNDLKKNSIEHINKFSLSKIFGVTHLSSDGRVVSKRSGINLLDKNSETNKQAIFEDMIKSYEIHINIIVNGQIIPSFQQLVSEHRITKNILYSLCLESSIVPNNRMQLWLEGIYAGFENNFIVSTHLLIPQVENLIRVKMKEKGIKTSVLDTNGIETEKGLSTLLNGERIEEIIDKNIVWEDNNKTESIEDEE